MAAYFFDSSAIVKLYVSETGSAWTVALVRSRRTDGVFLNRSNMASITTVEVTAALVRRSRGGSLSTTDLAAGLALFRADARRVFLTLRLTAAVLRGAATLAQKHALRGYDAVQLAVALALQAERSLDGLAPLIFVSADNELLAAAHLEGLPVDNPNLHP